MPQRPVRPPQRTAADVRHVAAIDGLRAFAVIAVLLFHGFPAVVPGGYIGVDVFFVISGYVIARSYLDRLSSREVSLADFYLRRVRRLAPAYTLVLLVSTGLAFWLLEPRMLRNFAHSLLAQPFYAQNFVFWIEGDYFDRALTKPLLHTWSLAIEEQFYLLFGAIIVAVRARRHLLVPLLATGSALSVALGVFLASRSPKTAFFLVPTRVWEFALGIAAYLLARRLASVAGTRWPTALTFVCLAALTAAVLAFGEATPFPGWNAALACGAVFVLLVLFDRNPSFRHWALTAPIVRRMGELSYALYLWHWPLLVFAYIGLGRELHGSEAALVLLVSGVLAELTYRYVETPIRSGARLRNLRALVRGWVVSSSALVTAGALLLVTGGALFRYPATVRPLWQASLEKSPYRCSKIFRLRNPSAEICPVNPVSDADGILIIGDSHADQLDELIAHLGAQASIPVFLTVRNCDLDEFGRLPYCARSVADAVISQARAAGVRYVIATSLWAEAGLDAAAFEEPVRDLLNAGIRTVFLSEVVPNGEFFDPVRRARGIISGEASSIAAERYALERYEAAVSSQRTIFEALRTRFPNQIEIIRPSDALCEDGHCDFATDGYPNYFDVSHLTGIGARRLEPLYADVISRVARERRATLAARDETTPGGTRAARTALPSDTR